MKIETPSLQHWLVTNIHNKLKNNSQDDNAPLDIHKNNWLHPDKDLFPNHSDKIISFGFLLALTLLLTVL